MKKIVFSIVMAVLLSIAVTAFAEEEKKVKNWSDQAEFSLVDTGGNSKTTTMSLKNEMKYAFNPKLNGLWKLGMFYGENDGETNAESYLTELKVDYLFTERLYSYGNALWLKNTFSGLNPRYSLGAGAGYKFLSGPLHTLVCEAGLGYVIDYYTDDSKHDYLNGRLFGKYTYAFTPKNSFSQSIEYLYDFSRSQNYNLISETALIAGLTDILSMKVSYTVRYANQPTPATLKNTDTILGVALVANF
ncbi:MAG: DUF481 domain-containing protein [Proteobacteria bacterium]|nr:DUF481 domain-containing protein [Pseudomonadota bacterium]